MSTVPGRQLGRELRDARMRAGVSASEAARALETSPARMYRIESGETRIKAIEVDHLAKLYAIPSELVEALSALAVEARARGWWHSYGQLIPSWFELYVGLESAASAMRIYESGLVPGLLQTPEYASAVLRLDTSLPQAEIERRVAARMERKAVLEKADVSVIVDEAVLHRPIADRAAMAVQLERMAATGVRVLPSSLGPHPASQAGGFVILEFPPGPTGKAEPTTIYHEALTGAAYLHEDSEVAAYEAVWAALADLALDVAASRALLLRVAEEVGNAGRG